jgi:hypothetical protein
MHSGVSNGITPELQDEISILSIPRISYCNKSPIINFMIDVTILHLRPSGTFDLDTKRIWGVGFDDAYYNISSRVISGCVDLGEK